MGFFAVIARYIAAEKLKAMGEQTLTHGREVFVQELAKGRSKEEAARIAAKAMASHAAGKGRGAIGSASGLAVRAKEQALRAARVLREKLRKP
ncbi:MAG: hypothetical protein V3573_00345 [Desulfovibrionaceae bacterium]